MKQTAVEWMFEQFFKVKWGSMQGNMPTIFEQAKEMEKEQMIEFANRFYDECGMQYGGLEKSAEQYYNETYGNEP